MKYKVSFFVALSLLLIGNVHGQIAKGNKIVSLDYSWISPKYIGVTVQRYEVKLGHFFFQNFYAGLYLAVENEPFVQPNPNSILGLRSGYNRYSAGFAAQKFFHIYKFLYLSLSSDIYVNKVETTPKEFGHTSYYSIGEIKGSIVGKLWGNYMFEVGNGQLNYSYSTESRSFGFNYGLPSKTFPRWYLGIKYYFNNPSKRSKLK